MIEMKVMGIALDTRTGSPIVVLNDLENRRALPIWIGSSEASSIIRKIENIEVMRPMTHDLVCTIIEETGYTLDRVEIHDVSEDTYFANLLLINDEGQELIIDSRPSDAIALALRAECPIFVTANVVADGTISTNRSKDDKEKEDFHNFIQNLKPSDFKKLIDDANESDQ
ncbi:MAG: bifunctional nuclease family protein [Candidatus Gastranaerophilales bacterium]|nr:bifunctional nuclease family protein [Candidatus Gastranaerophilales bacterium]